MRKLIVATAPLLATALQSPIAASDTAQALVGSWKLTSYKVQFVGEDVIEPFGPRAKGALAVTDSGRWMVMLTGGDRQIATNDAERAQLLGSMIAWTGRFTVEGDKVMSKVDASWNELYTGQLETQVRFVKMDGDTLSLRSPEMESAVRPGKRAVATLTFVRER